MLMQIEEQNEKKIESSYNSKDLFNITSNESNDYLWSEINNNLIKENEILLNNNSTYNLNFDIPKPKSILDSKFYLIEKIGKGSSAKVYLGLSIESPMDANNLGHLKYYSIKIMDPKNTDFTLLRTKLNY